MSSFKASYYNQDGGGGFGLDDYAPVAPTRATQFAGGSTDSFESQSQPELSWDAPAPPIEIVTEFKFVKWPVGLAFDINYILGVGVLNIPIAFYNAGAALGVLFLAFVSFVSAITVNYLMEAQARARTVMRLAKAGGTTGDSENSPLLLNQTKLFDELLPPNITGLSAELYTLESDEVVDSRDLTFYGDAMHRITTRKYENNMLCNIFLGKYGKAAYEIVLILFAWGGMWSYAVVFATSTASFIPVVGLTDGVTCVFEQHITPAAHCNDAYYIFMAIFACIVLPVSCLELTEQWLIQVTLTIYRFVALTIMIITTFLAMLAGPYKSYSVTESPPFIAVDSAFNWAGFPSVFSVAVFAQLMHHSVPGLSQHVDQKSKLRTMFFSGFTITFTFYSVVGILCSLYFGGGTQSLVTLNWMNYTGLLFDGSTDYSVFSRIIAYLVVLFPVFDILSAFPLNAVTVGNNMFFGLPDAWTGHGQRQWVKIACRFCAALPPLLLGTIIHNVAAIISFTGTLGFFLAFIFPSLLQLASIKRIKSLLGSAAWKTPFQWHFSHPYYALGITVLAGFGFVALVVLLALQTAGIIPTTPPHK